MLHDVTMILLLCVLSVRINDIYTHSVIAHMFSVAFVVCRELMTMRVFTTRSCGKFPLALAIDLTTHGKHTRPDISLVSPAD